MIRGLAADRFDILERGDHLKAVLAAVTAYVNAILKDTDFFSRTTIDDETPGLEDTAVEIVGAFLKANDRLQDMQADDAA